MAGTEGGESDEERPEPQRRRVNPGEDSTMDEIGRNLGEAARRILGLPPAEQPDSRYPSLDGLREELGEDHPLVQHGRNIVDAARARTGDAILRGTDIDAGLREITADSGAAETESLPESGQQDAGEPGESASDNT